MRQATFDSAAEGLRQMGASLEEQQLVEMLAKHAEHEAALLEKCQRLARDTASPAARYLVKLISEDEQRHHRVLAEMANAIAWEWSDNSPTEAVPDLTGDPTGKADGSLMNETRALLEAELQDRHELRRFKRRLKPYEDTTLWPLLVDVMLLDGEKHVRILRFIEEHLR